MQVSLLLAPCRQTNTWPLLEAIHYFHLYCATDGTYAAEGYLKRRNLTLENYDTRHREKIEYYAIHVDQHLMRMGNAAAAIFLPEIAAKNSTFVAQKVVLKPELIVRASSLKRITSTNLTSRKGR